MGVFQIRLRRLHQLWLTAFHTYSSPDPLSAEIRAAHLASVVRQTPLTVLANFVNGAVVCAAFAGIEDPRLLGAWAAALVLVGVMSVRASRRRIPSSVSPRAIRRAALHAAILAAIWAVVPVVFFPQAPPQRQLVVVALIVGMLSGGAFSLFMVPLASIAFVSVLTLAAGIALFTLGGPAALMVSIMLVGYAAVLVAGVLWAAQVATARLLSEREAERQREIVTLLLHDFEANASDALWEVDRELRFTHVSPRLAELLERAPDELMSAQLTQVLSALRPAEAAVAADVLQQAFGLGQGFHGITLDVELSRVRRCWSIRARCLRDAADAIIGWRGVVTDITDQRQAHARLAYLAHFDALTGLANRVRLRECVTEALYDAEQRGTRSALICLDIDNFKFINDAYGHAIGDGVLQAVARTISACIGSTGIAARLGGDEFALLIRDAPTDAVIHAVARRIGADLDQPTEVLGRKIRIGASLGIAFIPDHGASLDELLANADLALYSAKDRGRGRVEVFAPLLGERSRRRQDIANGLREALAQGGLEVHWQPKVDTNLWRVSSAEALLRWTHPALGPISPAEFIPVAEEHGLIDAVGEWVLRAACRQAAESLSDLVIAVNVSPAQFLRSEFLTSVARALTEAGLPPNRLEIEVTESLFLGELPIALTNLHGLRDMGVRIALDDFGTGYSGLAYLRRFPFDTLKIDRAFVRELMSTKDARAIVGMIIQLADTLGMTTVAEGVEDYAQLKVLNGAGCHTIQGFLFAKPMPLADVRRFIDEFEMPAQAYTVELAPARPSIVGPA